jgi:hypothetical protein
MLTINGPAGRLCDSWSRRELLTVGSLSLLGVGLPDVLRREAIADAAGSGGGAKRSDGFGRARSVILVYLQGSPSHIDLWDPKPEAPAEIRGEFRPIVTRAPGLLLGEVLPMLAQQADHFSLVRSIGVNPKGLRNHGAAIYMLMTGHDPTNFTATGLAVPPSREDLPSVGAVVARYRPAEVGRLGYVALCAPVKEGSQIGVGQAAGLLGATYDPFTMYDDPTQPLKLETFTLPGDVTLDRLHSRVDLRSAIDAERDASAKRLNSHEFSYEGGRRKRVEITATFDEQYDKALSLVQSNSAVRAFKLDEEPPPVRERYGMTRFGQSCLLARRLVEAGTRFVQVTWPARSDDEPAPGPDGSWDTHRNNFPTLRNDRCPFFDRPMSALIEDLAQRGLLETTLVVAIGEFGRSPKIGAPTTDNVGPGGRDHWPECYSFLIAGGGVRPGQVYGESDRFGAWPKTNPVHPYDVLATVHHALGIDPTTEYHDTLNRPRRLTERGRPIVGLF